jgi:hypothetical protein
MTSLDRANSPCESASPVRPLDPDAPASRGVAAWRRIAVDLIDVIATGIARADYWLELVEGIDVGYGLLSVAANSVHARSALGRMPGPAHGIGTAPIGGVQDRTERHEKLNPRQRDDPAEHHPPDSRGQGIQVSPSGWAIASGYSDTPHIPAGGARKNMLRPTLVALHRWRRYSVCLLEYALLSVTETLGTKPMRWLSGICSRLICVRKHTRRNVEWLIMDLLFIPCFKLHDFLFKFLFRCNQRLMMLLKIKHRLSGFDEARLKVE